MSKKKNEDNATLPDGKLRETIYARYPSDGQREESIEGQLRECKKFAELSKVRRGQMENALKNKANGGMVPFGYKVNADRYYETDPLTAPISNSPTHSC
jgi:hypothetical protein